MSISHCRECDELISSRAAECIYCGIAMPDAQRYWGYLLVHYLIPGLLLLGGLLYWWMVMLPELRGQLLNH